MSPHGRAEVVSSFIDKDGEHGLGLKIQGGGYFDIYPDDPRAFLRFPPKASAMVYGDPEGEGDIRRIRTHRRCRRHWA